jgi:predicted alpha/beta superfamily hydrolase
VNRTALVVALLPSLAVASPVRIEEHLVPARTYGADARRKVTVVLPRGYDAQSPRRYPVVYMLDGQNLVDRSAMHGGWKIDERIADSDHQRRVEPAIVVGVHAENRMHEYTPTFDREQNAGGGAHDHMSFIANDVVKFVDQNYHTRADRESRAIGGASLGGLAALHGLLHQSDTFANGLLFSPSVWWNNHAVLNDVTSNPAVNRIRKVFIYNGEDNREGAERLRDALHQRGLQFNDRLYHWHQPGGTHDEVHWRDHFTLGMSALFPNQ